MQIRVHQFEGPLDLLLKLIEEQKLEINQISLASVTEQFLEYLRSQTKIEPQALADWLVIAAKLLVIKSKALLPALNLPEEEEEEASNLTWQLYQYKKYKECAKYLIKLDDKRKQSWGRQASFVEKITFYPDNSVTTATMSSAMRYIAKTLAEIAKLPKKVLEEVITISEKIEHMQNMIHKKVEMRLKDLVKKAKSKIEVIVTFLALLELVKQKILTTEQEAMFSDIIIRKNNNP